MPFPPGTWNAAANIPLKPFGEVITPDRIRHHFIGQDQGRGVYAKEVHLRAGEMVVSHAHQYDHLSVLGSGMVVLTVDGEKRSLVGPAAVTIAAHRHHKIQAITDAVWYCIHPTDETDPAKVDEVILKGG